MFSASNKTFFLKISKFNFHNFNKNIHLFSSNTLGFTQYPEPQEELPTSIDCKGRNSKTPKRVLSLLSRPIMELDPALLL